MHDTLSMEVSQSVGQISPPDQDLVVRFCLFVAFQQMLLLRLSAFHKRIGIMLLYSQEEYL